MHFLLELCRLCNNYSKVTKSLFSFDTDNITYIDKLYAVIPGHIKTDNILPNRICTHCIVLLNEAYNIIKGFLKAQSVLVRYSKQLQNNFVRSGNEDEEKNNVVIIEKITKDIYSNPVKFMKHQYILRKRKCIIESNKHVKAGKQINNEQTNWNSKLISDNSNKSNSKDRNETSLNKIIDKEKVLEIAEETKLLNEKEDLNILTDDKESQKENTLEIAEETKLLNEKEDLIILTEDKESQKENTDKVNSEDCEQTDDKKDLDLELLNNHLFVKEETNLEFDYPDVKSYLPLKKELIDVDNNETNAENLHETFETNTGRIKDEEYLISGDSTDCFICETCGNIFINSLDFFVHLKSHSDFKYKCKMCGKVFDRQYTLERHSRVHTNEKPFKCHQCGKAFAQKHTLKNHIRSIHTNERPFKCNICEKTFPQSAHLKYHIKKHTNDRPFVCRICNRGFIQSINLKEHILIHSKEKIYKCTICEKSFRTNSSLKIHIHNVHESNESYTCEICDKVFRRRENFKKHLRNVHYLNDVPKNDLGILKTI